MRTKCSRCSFSAEYLDTKIIQITFKKTHYFQLKIVKSIINSSAAFEEKRWIVAEIQHLTIAIGKSKCRNLDRIISNTAIDSKVAFLLKCGFFLF